MDAVRVFLLELWRRESKNTASSMSFSLPPTRPISTPPCLWTIFLQTASPMADPEGQSYWTVNGRTYDGKVISKIQTLRGNVSYAWNNINNHPVGSQVTIFYDPSNSGDAVLEENTAIEKVTLLFISVLFAAMVGGGRILENMIFLGRIIELAYIQVYK